MNKKAIAILGAIFLLIVGTLGYLVYSRYSAKSTATNTPPPQQNNNNGSSQNQNNPASSTTSPLPGGLNTSTSTIPVASSTSAGGVVIKLSDGPVISPILFYNGNGLTYFNTQGQLYQADFATSSSALQLVRPRTLAVPQKSNISRIIWPPKGDGFIAQINNNGQTSWSSFNGQSGTYTDLPSQVQYVDWMPTGDKIIYVWYDAGKSSLSIANPDASGYKTVGSLYYPDDAVSVSPDGLNIAFYRTGSNDVTNPVNGVTPDGKVWKTFVKDGFNYGVLWSPDSQKFLFARKDSATQKYQLWVYNLLTNTASNLGLFTTVDKAAWSGDSQAVYAAVPVTGTAGSGLTVDTFYKVSLIDLSKQELNPGSGTIDGRNLFLSGDGNDLFFKNAQDSGLYYLNVQAARASTAP